MRIPEALRSSQPNLTGLCKSRSGGFTMIELLVVIAIFAVMAALAAPSMTRLIAGQRLKGAATDLHLSLTKARSEAIKRNADVTVDPSGGNWANGWSVVNPSDPAAPLDVRGVVTSVSIATTASSVVYNGSGRTTPASSGGSFVFSSSATDATRCLSIDPSGRPYVKEGSAC